ncbi:MAG TPA: peptidoglycan binding domain-containing protein, partial [Patescibacteria group bacterium]
MSKDDSTKKEILTKLKPPKWLIILLAVFLLFSGILAGSVYAYQKAYASRIYPGVMIGQFKVGGQPPQKIAEALQQKAGQINREGLKFQHGNQRVDVLPVLSAADPDLAKEVFSFNINQTVSRALSVGRQGNFLKKLFGQLSALMFPKRLEIVYRLNQEELLNILKNSFSQFEQPAESARLKVLADNQLTVISEKSGSVFDYHTVIAEAGNNLSQLTDTAIALNLVKDEPNIKSQDTAEAVEFAKTLITRQPPILKYEDQTWELTEEDLAQNINFVSNSPVITAAFDPKLFGKYLGKIAEEINVEPREAKFVIQSDQRVKEFQASREGIKLNIEETVKKLNQEFIKNNQTEIELVVETDQPQATTENINDLGIREVIGVGTSNFAGSPPNRRHNIRVGAAALNGLLLKPGEEFSLIKALGNIDAANGYLPEL